MPVNEHAASSRNNTQVRVAGLNPPLRNMGYCRDVRVRVTDAGGDLTREP